MSADEIKELKAQFSQPASAIAARYELKLDNNIESSIVDFAQTAMKLLDLAENVKNYSIDKNADWQKLGRTEVSSDAYLRPVEIVRAEAYQHMGELYAALLKDVGKQDDKTHHRFAAKLHKEARKVLEAGASAIWDYISFFEDDAHRVQPLYEMVTALDRIGAYEKRRFGVNADAGIDMEQAIRKLADKVSQKPGVDKLRLEALVTALCSEVADVNQGIQTGLDR